MKKITYSLFLIFALSMANTSNAQTNPRRGGSAVLANSNQAYRLADRLRRTQMMVADLILEPECGLVNGVGGTPPRPLKYKDGSFKFKITQTIANYSLEVASSGVYDVIDITNGTYTSNHTSPCYIRMVDKVIGGTIYYSINGSFPNPQISGYNLCYTTSPITCQ